LRSGFLLNFASIFTVADVKDSVGLTVSRISPLDVKYPRVLSFDTLLLWHRITSELNGFDFEDAVPTTIPTTIL
jgi:hypothetical protein